MGPGEWQEGLDEGGWIGVKMPKKTRKTKRKKSPLTVREVLGPLGMLGEDYEPPKKKKKRTLTAEHKAKMQAGRKRAKAAREGYDYTKDEGLLLQPRQLEIPTIVRKRGYTATTADRNFFAELIGQRKALESTVKARFDKLKKAGQAPPITWQQAKKIVKEEVGFRQPRGLKEPAIRPEKSPGKVGSIKSWDKLAIRGRPVEGREYFVREFNTGSVMIAREDADDPYEVVFTPKRKGSKPRTIATVSSRRKALKEAMALGTPLEYGVMSTVGPRGQLVIDEPDKPKRGRPRKEVVVKRGRGRPRKYQTTEEFIGKKIRGRKRADKPAEKQFRNWKWNTSVLPDGDTQITHSEAGYGAFIMQEHKGGYYLGFKPPRSNAYGIKPDGTLTPKLGGKGLKFDDKESAIAQMRVFAKSIGANPATGANAMPPFSLVPTRRRSAKNSPAYRKMEDQLNRTKKNLRRRNAEVRDYRLETEGGNIAKAVTVSGGVISSALLPGALKKPGTDIPMLTRGGRRAARLGIGIPLALWGRRYHPLASLFGWAFAGTEVVFSAMEWAGKDESGKMPEYGAIGDYDEDDFFEEDDDDMDLDDPEADYGAEGEDWEVDEEDADVVVI